MDNTEGKCRQNASMSKTISCSSSSTLIESVTSTAFFSLDSERCCPSLDQLPTRVLFVITSHLDVVSRICLQGVNDQFRRVIEVDRADLSTCARYVLARHFSNGNSSNGLTTICVLCKTSHNKKRYSEDRIRCIRDPRRRATSWTARTLARIPWVRHYASPDWNERCLIRFSQWGRSNCDAHFMEKFATDPHIESLMKFAVAPEVGPTWLAFTVLRCTHCGKCISEGDSRLEGCLDCMCDFCTRAPEYHWRRCGPGHSDQIRPRQVYMNPITQKSYALEGHGKNMIVVPVVTPKNSRDGTHLLGIHMCYIDKPRAVRPHNMRRITQQSMTCFLDTQARKKAEIFRSLKKKGISTGILP